MGGSGILLGHGRTTSTKLEIIVLVPAIHWFRLLLQCQHLKEITQYGGTKCLVITA